MSTETRYCLALYSKTPFCITPIAWLELASAWCDRLRTPVDTVCISGKGYSKGPQKPNRASAELQRKGAVDGLEIYRTISGYKQLVFGWEVGWTFHPEQGVLAVAIPAGVVADPFSLLAQIAEDIVSKNQVGYGIAYERVMANGPLLYAVGMSAGLGYSDEGMREGDMIATWMSEIMDERRYLDGMLREVYALNLLTANHLARSIDGKRLVEWITSTPTHGNLRQLTADCWLWQIHGKDMAAVRRELVRADLLICA